MDDQVPLDRRNRGEVLVDKYPRGKMVLFDQSFLPFQTNVSDMVDKRNDHMVIVATC